jgi:hypothetical protein
MVIDYKKILETNTEFYKKYYEFDETHHLHRMPGEHYKLLTYLSYLYDGITILDVGTSLGESCLALAQNKKNKVISYDIRKEPLSYLKDYENIEYKILDINLEDINIIKSAKIIFFDIGHDGVAEKKFSDMLEKIDYKGYVFCDDVFSKIYPQCTDWFSKLNIEKYDISEVGHSSPIYGHGTGLLNYYNDNSVTIIK